jgi:hypothetical protein
MFVSAWVSTYLLNFLGNLVRESFVRVDENSFVLVRILVSGCLVLVVARTCSES